MSIKSVTGAAGSNIHTTARCELFGWCGVMTWLFLMIYAYDIFILGTIGYFEGSWHQFFFMLLFAISIAAFGFRFGRDPNGLGKISFYTTPAAIGITAALGFLPQPFCSVLYVLSPVFMAPAITRRVYGVVRTAEPGRMLLRYAAGFSASWLAFGVWVACEPAKETALLIPALLSIPAWTGIRRSLTVPEELPERKAFRFTKRYAFALAAAVAVTFWLIIMGRMILTNIFAGGDETTVNALNALLTWTPPAVCVLLYGVISDKGHERAGFICIMGISLLGCITALLPGIPQGAATLSLVLAFCFGEIYVEYLAYTVPLYFLKNAKRPVFAASFGCVYYLVIAAFEWKKDVWLPKELMELGTPLLVSAAISVVVFIILVYFLFERHREKTLASALYAMLHSSRASPAAEIPAQTAAPAPDESPKPDARSMTDAGFTPEETEVALLLIEGETQHGISRKLHRPAADVSRQLDAIRDKINQMSGFTPLIAAIARKYRLTRRETDMLRCLHRSMTNAEIAAALFLSEETVKIHVRNLMKKLPVENRTQVAPWAETFDEKVE